MKCEARFNVAVVGLRMSSRTGHQRQKSDAHPIAIEPYWTKVQYTRSLGSRYFSLKIPIGEPSAVAPRCNSGFSAAPDAQTRKMKMTKDGPPEKTTPDL